MVKISHLTLSLFFLAAAEVAELEKAGKLPEEDKPKQDTIQLPAGHQQQQPMNWPPMQVFNHFNGDQPQH